MLSDKGDLVIICCIGDGLGYPASGQLALCDLTVFYLVFKAVVCLAVIVFGGEVVHIEFAGGEAGEDVQSVHKAIYVSRSNVQFPSAITLKKYFLPASVRSTVSPLYVPISLNAIDTLSPVSEYSYT